MAEENRDTEVKLEKSLKGEDYVVYQATYTRLGVKLLVHGTHNSYADFVENVQGALQGSMRYGMDDVVWSNTYGKTPSFRPTFIGLEGSERAVLERIIATENQRLVDFFGGYA